MKTAFSASLREVIHLCPASRLFVCGHGTRNYINITFLRDHRPFKGRVKHMPTVRATYVNRTCDICQPYVRHMSTVRATIVNRTCDICFTSPINAHCAYAHATEGVAGQCAGTRPVAARTCYWTTKVQRVPYAEACLGLHHQPLFKPPPLPGFLSPGDGRTKGGIAGEGFFLFSIIFRTFTRIPLAFNCILNNISRFGLLCVLIT